MTERSRRGIDRDQYRKPRPGCAGRRSWATLGQRPRRTTMYEQHVNVTTKHGIMPSFVACPDGAGPFPAIIFYMDAPGTREELRNMTRRIARHGYFCILPAMYYRLGTVLFDLPRRNDAMSAVIRDCMNSINNELVTDDTAA